MIQLKKLNDIPIVVNSDLIEFIEVTPDTIITLTNNDKLVVKESLEEIIQKVVQYKRTIAGLVKIEHERSLRSI